MIAYARMTDINLSVARNFETVPLVFIGTSGVGKTTIAKELEKQSVVTFNKSHTTRQKRYDDDDDHIYVTEEEFGQLEQSGYFMDVVDPFNNGDKYGYAPVYCTEGTVPLILVRALILPLLDKHFSKYICYQIEAPDSRISLVMNQRGEPDYSNRMKIQQLEVEKGREIASRVFVNEDLIDTVEKIKQAIGFDLVTF